MSRFAGVIGVIGLLSGCQASGVGPGVPGLWGQVRWPVQRQVAATLADVANGATVSLIDVQNNLTEVTALTDASGAFSFQFPTAYKPTEGRYYYIEAIKGLGGNMPGNSAVRVRTLARFSSGWVTLTNSTSQQGIVVDESTTAVAIAAALQQAASVSVDLPATIGAVDPASRQYHPVEGVSQQDFQAVLGLVNHALEASRDPVREVTLTSGEWSVLATGLEISGLQPASGRIGESLRILGSGFDADPSGDGVCINGLLAPVRSASRTWVEVEVPDGCRAGPVSVSVGALTCRGPTFTVTGALPGWLDPASPGQVWGAISPDP